MTTAAEANPRLYLKLGVSATRHGLSSFQQGFFMQFIRDKCGEVHHGDCVGGDAQLHDIAAMFPDFWKIHIHPPANSELRAFKISSYIRPPLPYLQRNKNIVSSTSILLGFPKSRQESGGTWRTINYAREAIAQGQERCCFIILPDGTCGEVQFLKKGSFAAFKSLHDQKHQPN